MAFKGYTKGTLDKTAVTPLFHAKCSWTAQREK